MTLLEAASAWLCIGPEATDLEVGARAVDPDYRASSGRFCSESKVSPCDFLAGHPNALAAEIHKGFDVAQDVEARIMKEAECGAVAPDRADRQQSDVGVASLIDDPGKQGLSEPPAALALGDDNWFHLAGGAVDDESGEPDDSLVYLGNPEPIWPYGHQVIVELATGIISTNRVHAVDLAVMVGEFHPQIATRLEVAVFVPSDRGHTATLPQRRVRGEFPGADGRGGR